MTMDHLAELARWTNVLLSAAAAAIVIAGTVYRWESLPRHEQRVRPWLGMLLLTIAYGSGEAAAQDAPVGLRVFFGVVSLLGLVVSLLMGFREDDRRPTTAP